MIWEEVDNDFVAKTKNVVYRLKLIDIGFYGSGKAYTLQARKVDEVKETSLGFAFWFNKDSSDRYKSKSVGGKLWNMKSEIFHIKIKPDTTAIKKEAEKILKGLGFIS